MSLIILVSLYLLALVVTSRPVLPVQNLTGDRPVALRNAVQAIFDNLSRDVPDPLFREGHEVHTRLTSAEEQNEYLVQLDDKAVDSLSENEVPPAEDNEKSHEILGNSQLDDLDNDVKAPTDSAISVELASELVDGSPAESDRSSGNSTNTSFVISPPLLVLTFSSIIALLGVLCVAVALYITRYLRSKISASMETLEMLPRFGKGDGQVGLPEDSRGSHSFPETVGITTGRPRDTLAGGNMTPLAVEKPEELVLDVEKLVDLPDLAVNQSHDKLVDDSFEQAVDPLEDPVLPLQYPVLTCEYPAILSEVKIPPILTGDNPWELAREEEGHSDEKEVEEEDEEDMSETFHDVEDVTPGILITVDNDSLKSSELGSVTPGQLYADPDLMPLPVSVHSSVSGSPVSASSSPAVEIQMRESPQSSPISRPAWSLRAFDAPALGVPSNTGTKPNTPRHSPIASPIILPSLPASASSSPTHTPSPLVELAGSSTATSEVVPARRRAYRSQVPEFDIALAMQLRPGLGLGADPAWMVRFLMAMFGWLTVLLTGKKAAAVKAVTAKKE